MRGHYCSSIAKYDDTHRLSPLTVLRKFLHNSSEKDSYLVDPIILEGDLYFDDNYYVVFFFHIMLAWNIAKVTRQRRTVVVQNQLN